MAVHNALAVAFALIGATATRAFAAPLDGAAPPAASIPATEPTATVVGADAAADPELLAPLTPLDQFQVQTQTPSGPAPAAPSTLSYSVEFNGLSSVGLLARFRSLSTLFADRGKPATRVQVNARAAEDVKLAERLLRSEGYYDGHAEASMANEPGEQGRPARLRVTITATPGDRYHLGTIAVTGPQTAPPDLARRALTLTSGQPLIAQDVEQAEGAVILQLPQHGYPFAALGQRDVVLDPATHAGDYTLPVTPGPRSSFGGVRVAGDPVFKPEHIVVIERFKRGEIYDSRMVDDLRRALVATALYSSVGVAPVDTGQRAPDGTEAVDVVVTGQKAPSRTLSGSLGYETGLGATLETAWTDRNLFAPEGSLTLHGIAGTQQQLLGTTFRRLNAGQRDRSVQATAQASRENVDAYLAKTIRLAGSISRDSTPIWQKRWTYSAGGELSLSQETGYDLSVGRSVRRTYEIIAAPLMLGYDRSDSLLDPTKGFRVAIRPSPELSIGDGTRPYFKALFDASAYHPFGSAFVLAGRVRLGGLFGAASKDIAPSRRFYAGGGGSVRGFGYQELGPKDPSNNAIGGSSLTEFSVEGRYRFGDFGVVSFVDAGQVYQTAFPSFGDTRYGVGVGGRFYTNFGPLRFDVATPLARRAGESLVSVYISIGQAF